MAQTLGKLGFHPTMAQTPGELAFHPTMAQTTGELAFHPTMAQTTGGASLSPYNGSDPEQASLSPHNGSDPGRASCSPCSELGNCSQKWNVAKQGFSLSISYLSFSSLATTSTCKFRGGMYPIRNHKALNIPGT